MRTSAQAVTYARSLEGSSLVNGTPGWCAYWVWDIYGRPPVRITSFETAADMWRYGTAHSDRAIPAGGIAYLGPRAGTDENARAGDVIVHLGGGLFRASDYPHNGVFGICTLAEREAETGRSYVGWLSDVVGNRISFELPSPPPNELDYGMEPFIITINAAARKYLYTPATGRKRGIDTPEWQTMRAGQKAGVTLKIAYVSADLINAIPGK